MVPYKDMKYKYYTMESGGQSRLFRKKSTKWWLYESHEWYPVSKLTYPILNENARESTEAERFTEMI